MVTTSTKDTCIDAINKAIEDLWALRAQLRKERWGGKQTPISETSYSELTEAIDMAEVLKQKINRAID